MTSEHKGKGKTRKNHHKATLPKKGNIQHRSYAFLLEDVMFGNFSKGFAQEDLWAFVASKPIQTYKMDDVKHWIFSPCWSYSGRRECFYSPFQVLLQKDRFASDMSRIKKADISYPIIVVESEFDKFGVILDGNHRFSKMYNSLSSSILE